VGIVKVVARAGVVAAGACALCCSPVAPHALSAQQTTVASVVPSPPAAAPVAPSTFPATLIAAPFARGIWSVSHSRSGTRWLVVRTQHAGELWSLSSAGDFERVSLPEAFNPQAVWARDEQDV
jgi:hypothetical protein